MAKNNLENKIDSLTNAIEKLISREVAPVAPIAPIAPVAPVLPLIQQNPLDHELLTRLDERFSGLDKKFDAISTKLDTKYTTIEEHKVVTDIQIDHEKRIRITEVFQNTLTGKMWAIGGIAGIISTTMGIIISHYLSK